MHLTRIAPLLALAVAAALAGGCLSPRPEAGGISNELERRSGYAVTNTKPGEVTWPATVTLDDGLSEDEAVTLALWNNAGFQETLADLGIAQADLVQAGMLPNPTLSLLIPAGAKPLELTAKYPLEVLWLRPKRVAAANLDYERTAQRLVQYGLDLIRDVRLACADLTLAQERLKLAQETLALTQGIADLSRARLQAGDVSALEAGQAEIDTLQVREQVARLHQEAQIAGERLRHLTGLGLERWTERIVVSPISPHLGLGVNVCLTNALAARPDLRATELGLEAAGERIGLARRETFTLAAGVNAKDVGSGANKEFLPGPTLDFAVPILNQNQGGVAQAKARFAKAARQYFTVRDRIVHEVREAHTRRAQAQESFGQWHERILPPLQESVRQAEKAFAAGNISYLFVLETMRKLQEARLQEAAATAGVRRASAELERSIGQRLDLSINNP